MKHVKNAICMGSSSCKHAVWITAVELQQLTCIHADWLISAGLYSLHHLGREAFRKLSKDLGIIVGHWCWFWQQNALRRRAMFVDGLAHDWLVFSASLHISQI